MNKREMQKFKKLLLAEADHLSKGIKTIERNTIEGTLSESTGDLTSFAEAGTDNNDRETALRVASGESVAGAAEAARESVLAAGFTKVDYLSIYDPTNFEEIAIPDASSRVLAAAWLGQTRLIDNIPFVADNLK